MSRRAETGTGPTRRREANGDAPEAQKSVGSPELRKQDEILQLLFWMRGEGLGEVVRPADLQVFLAPGDDARELSSSFWRLVDKGLLESVEREGDPGPAFRLTDQGILEGGRRFADEFADIAGQAHGQCDDPDCACHDDPEAAVACHEERHTRGEDRQEP